MSILWLAAICAALGIGCLLTPWHIGMTGVCLLLLAAVLLACHFLRGEKGKRWRRVLWSLAALGMALVFGMMGFIALDGRDNAPEEDVPFVVVLGAQTHGDRPSRTLRERLDLAADYLEAHPAARVIVSGGQGADDARKSEQCEETGRRDRNFNGNRSHYYERISSQPGKVHCAVARDGAIRAREHDHAVDSEGQL